MLDKFRNWYRELPDKKKYIEFISALLSVPVMATVILLNLNSLTQKNNAQPVATPTPVVTRVVETLQPVNIMQNVKGESSSSPATSSAVPTPTPKQCKAQVGPITIVNPHENEVISGGSVCVTFDYQQDGYCDVVWSYSLDNASWSDYSASSICLYNLSGGTHVLGVKVKSVSSDNQIVLQRTFINSVATPTVAPTATPTATPALTQSTSSATTAP